MKSTQLTALMQITFFLVLFLSETNGTFCDSDGTSSMKICTNQTFVGNTLLIDTTDLFLDTFDRFCYCEIKASQTLALVPANSSRTKCGALLSVKISPYVTLRQFTCQLSDPVNVTSSEDHTVYLELRGVGTLDVCLEITSEEEFSLTCYTKGYIPLALITVPTTPVSTTLVSTTPTTPNSTAVTPTSGTTLLDDVTGSSTIFPKPLASGPTDDSFVLILTACALGSLAVVAVVLLLICKCVRQVRQNRRKQRENTSYDITLNPTVEKLSSRRLDSNDMEPVIVDHCLYETTKNGRVSQHIVKETVDVAVANSESESAQNSDGILYVDLDHSDFKPIVKCASKPDKDIYAVVKRQK